MFELMKLPFKEDALEPYVSAETVRFHYDKHHRGYVNKVNELIAGTDFQTMPLEDIIEMTFDKPEYQALYNNAGQVFNHNMYWNSIGIGAKFDKETEAKIEAYFGTRDALREKLADKATAYFGSGWAWLAEGENGVLDVLTTRNGDTPLVLGYKPILNIDVWEHAYYLDYQNRRKDYASAFVEHLLKI